MKNFHDWAVDHKYNCESAWDYVNQYENVAVAFAQTSDNIDYMLRGIWEQSMDGLCNGLRDELIGWVEDVRAAYPEQAAGDGWPIGSIPEAGKRFAHLNIIREFADSIVGAFTEERDKQIVLADLCDRLRGRCGNPMSNAK